MEKTINVKDFFETKRTYRKFMQKQIPDEVLEDILEAGRLYSSGANKQAVKYVVVRTPEQVKRLNSFVRYAGYLPKEVGTPKEDEIPVLFIAVVQDTKLAPASDTDAGLAIGNMTVAAWMSGVGSCIMGAIDRNEIKAMLGIAEDDILHTVIAFGYPKKQSRTVEYTGDIKYFLDENGDTCVPKRSRDEVIRFFD